MNDKVETVCWLSVTTLRGVVLLLFSAECAAPFSFTQLAVHLFRVNSTVLERESYWTPDRQSETSCWTEPGPTPVSVKSDPDTWCRCWISVKISPVLSGRRSLLESDFKLRFWPGVSRHLLHSDDLGLDTALQLCRLHGAVPGPVEEFALWGWIIITLIFLTSALQKEIQPWSQRP